MKRVSGWLQQRPRLVFALCVLAVPLVEYGDWKTGPDARFDLFYFIPISLVTWVVGQRSGLFLSGLSALGAATAAFFESSRYLLWNTFEHLAVFTVLVLALTALRRALEREQRLARVDPLTGVANRRMFLESAAAELERSRRYGHPFSLAILDLDNFKAVNDERGHAEGDAVLRTAAEVIRSTLRSTDSVARMGGDEFALFLPEAGPAAAREACEKLRVRMQVAFREGGWPVTASLGAVTYNAPPEDLDAVIRHADALLYRAKGSGKDGLVHATGD